MYYCLLFKRFCLPLPNVQEVWCTIAYRSTGLICHCLSFNRFSVPLLIVGWLYPIQLGPMCGNFIFRLNCLRWWQWMVVINQTTCEIIHDCQARSLSWRPPASDFYNVSQSFISFIGCTASCPVHHIQENYWMRLSTAGFTHKKDLRQRNGLNRGWGWMAIP